MSLEQNKAIVRRHMEGLDRRIVDTAAAECAPNAIWYGFGSSALNEAGWRGAIAGFLSGFPDSRFATDAVIAEGDLVAVRHSFHGTHNGVFQGIPPTGKLVAVPTIVIFRLADGKIVETWLNADLLGLMMQIGAVPAPDPQGL